MACRQKRVASAYFTTRLHASAFAFTSALKLSRNASQALMTDANSARLGPFDVPG